MLYGRDTERAAIERLLARATEGRSGVLVVHGVAGSGKTALLEYAADAGAAATVLRCTGIESEAELPFAGLHQLLRAHLARLDALPGPQAVALRAAFGLADGAPVDRFLVGLATLTLLADIAAEGPLLCLVDDAQWLDRASLGALSFAARRLDAEGVLLVFAQRDDEPDESWELRRIGECWRLDALAPDAAGALLADRAGRLDPAARQRIVEEAAGNPLALIELAAALDASGTGAVEAEPIGVAGGRVAREFGRQVGRLPARTRTALLVAAADGTGELGVVLAAAERVGAGLTDFEPAEWARLVWFEGRRVLFRHPLIRSVVYERAAYEERVRVHRALAAALGGGEHGVTGCEGNGCEGTECEGTGCEGGGCERDGFGGTEYADRRAWHLAAAAVGFDEAAAAGLEAAAARADLRGGYAASAAAHETAARLTAEPALRARRLAGAASAARDAGQLDRAAALAADAAPLTDDPALRSRLDWVRARVEFERGTPRRAYEMLLAAAPRAGEAGQTARMLTEAVRMAYFADDPVTITRAVPLLRRVVLPDGDPVRPYLGACAILAELLSGTAPDELPSLAAALDGLRLADLDGPVGGMHGQAASLVMLAGRVEEALDETDRLMSVAREQGLIGGLPHLLLVNAEANLAAGRLPAALAAGTEGLRIAEDTGQGHSANNLRGVLARATALTGDGERCVAVAEEAARYGREHGMAASVVTAELALSLLDLANGRYGPAYERLAGLDGLIDRQPLLATLAPPEWIEAAVRSGNTAGADEMLARYEAWTTRHQDRRVAYAIAARCRALLAPDGEAEKHYRAALEAHRQLGRPLARARTELLYGEWLRRMRRPADARVPLAAARRAFVDAGARPWAERARSELRAAGATVTDPARQRHGLDRLTAQELQVVRLAAAGLSNRDIGARLFLSPRTVGYHLYKAYPKLGVASRIELTALGLT